MKSATETLEDAPLKALEEPLISLNSEGLRKLIEGSVAVGVREALEDFPVPYVASPQQITDAESYGLMIVGHEVIIPRFNEHEPILNAVKTFSKVRVAADDVSCHQLTKLTLWKAAELGMTADEVIEILKIHSRTPPRAALRNWINRTMSTYGALIIVGENTFNALESVDEDTMSRILGFSDVRKHIYNINRRIAPNKVRIKVGHRADLKRVLLQKGYPVKDYGLIDEFPSLQINLKQGIKPRYPHQDEALKRFMEMKNGVFVGPPGSGKTRTAVEATVALKAPTLFFTNRGNLCEQVKAEYLEWTDISPRKIATFHSGSKDRYVRDITITTYQMAVNPGKNQKRLVNDIWKTKWGLIIFDECQHIPADLWRKTAERIQTLHKLGLTATDVREDKKEAEIFSLIGPPILSLGWLDMAAEGYIADAVTWEVLVGMPPSRRTAYNRSRGFKQVILTASNPEKIRIVKKLLERHAQDPTIIIGYYKDGAKEMADAIGALLVSGDTPMSKREPIYESFRRGEIDRLVLTQVGEEGVNLPNARVAINVASLYGSRMGFSQRLGRILRPKEGTATFYELVTVGTVEEEYSERRRAFLVGQGYDFETIDMTGVI